MIWGWGLPSPIHVQQNVHDMFTTCSPHVHHMFTTCSPHVYHMFTTCSQHITVYAPWTMIVLVLICIVDTQTDRNKLWNSIILRRSKRVRKRTRNGLNLQKYREIGGSPGRQMQKNDAFVHTSNPNINSIPQKDNDSYTFCCF